MKTITILLAVFLSSSVSAEMSADTAEKFVSVMQKQLKLDKYIGEIKNGRISTERYMIIHSILKNTSELYIHRQRGALDNKVYLHEDGHKEAVFDGDGKPVKDGINDGSYNYFHPRNEPLRHFTFDISPWILLGSSRTDPTKKSERIHSYMSDIEGGIRKAIKQIHNTKAKAAISWKKTGQIQALSVFIKAIELGGAQELFDFFESNKVLTDKELISTLNKLKNGFNKIY